MKSAEFRDWTKSIERMSRSQRGGKAAKRGTSTEQIPVLVVRDRHGETADPILRGISAEQSERS